MRNIIKVLTLLFFITLTTSNICFAESQSLFNSDETKYKSFNLFPKWTGVLSKHNIDITLYNQDCKNNSLKQCIIKNWLYKLDKLKDHSSMQKLNAVNQLINKHSYVTDLINWNIDDYWATPKEFISKDGDCEDFAIAKFKSLLYLGFKNEDMRIVILQDLNLQIAHAVLAVYVNGIAYILDNQAQQVIPSVKIKHYIPIYSINQANWWLHTT